MRCYDTQRLRLKGRELSPPFQLVLDAEPSCRNLTCTAILRHLPGKRLVCAGHRNHQPCVAKIFLDPSGCERHYQRELSGIKALQAARIPTPELLFEGRLAEGHAPVLLFRQMTAYEDLTKRLAKTDKPQECLGALRLAVKAIARLHAAGLKQRDIHPGNFLLSTHSVMIIDGDDIESPPGAIPLSPSESLSNLALFLAQFYPSFDDLLPDLVTVYAASRNLPETNRLQEIVRSETQRWRKWRLKKFIPKTQRSCTAFHVQKSWRRFVAWDREWYSPTWQPLIENPDSFIESGTILKAGNSATVAKITIGAQMVVVKRYNIKNAGHALRRCLRPSRAMVSWKNAHRLRFLGINTPRPLAVIERRWGFLRQRAYFIMAHMGGVTLEQALHEAVRAQQAVEGRLDELVALLEQLATARISHGDFKATNFLLSAGRLYLADLDGMRAHRSHASFKKAFHRDLKRLLHNWQNLPLVNQRLAKRLEQFIG